MSTNDTAGLSRRDFVRVGAGASAAAAASATRRTEALEVQDDGNETGGNETGGDQSGENETDGNETGGGGETPQGEGNVGEEGQEGEPPAEQAGGDLRALFGIAGVLAFLSPIALVVLLYRNARRERDEF